MRYRVALDGLLQMAVCALVCGCGAYLLTQSGMAIAGLL